MSIWFRVGIPCAIFLVAFAFLFQNITTVAGVSADEIYYVAAAVKYTEGDWIVEKNATVERDFPWNPEHPPLGKLLMAASYALHGTPLSDLDRENFSKLCQNGSPACAPGLIAWRLPGVLVASLGVVGAYWIAARAFGSVLAGGLAATFLLMDHLYFVMARLAYLDIYSIGFALLAFGLYLGGGRHRILGSIAFGLAISSKLTGWLLIPTFALLAYILARQAATTQEAAPNLFSPQLWKTVGRDAFLIPFAVYVATYLPFWVAWMQITNPIVAFFGVQQVMFSSGYGLQQENAYLSSPWEWPLVARPMLLFVHIRGRQNDGEFVYSLGNIALWWLALLVAGSYFVRLVMEIAKSRGSAAAGVVRVALDVITPTSGRNGLYLVVVFLLGAYLPFFVLSRDTFMFYFVAVTPFLSLVLAGGMTRWLRRGEPVDLRRTLFALVLVLAYFVVLYPLAAGVPLTESGAAWRLRSIPWMDYK